MKGTIPGPVLFGYLFDASSLLWQQECNGARGNCFDYDNQKLGYLFAITYTILKIISCIFALLACKLYKAPITMTSTIQKEACSDAECDRNGIINTASGDIFANGALYKAQLGQNISTYV